MDRLRALFAGLGLQDVSTFIASGNVVFSTDSRDVDALRDTIESHLLRELGYDVATFLRSPAELAAIVALRSNRGRDADAGRRLALRDPTGRPCSGVAALGSESAELRHGRVPLLGDRSALAHPGQAHRLTTL